MYDFTNRIFDDHAGDQRCEDAADGRGGVGETHKSPGKVRSEIHVIDSVATAGSDIAGYSDYEDAHG